MHFLSQDDAQKVSILSNDGGTKLSEVVGHVNQSFGNSLEELTVTVKDDDEKHHPQRYRLMYRIVHTTKITNASNQPQHQSDGLSNTY